MSSQRMAVLSPLVFLVLIMAVTFVKCSPTSIIDYPRDIRNPRNLLFRRINLAQGFSAADVPNNADETNKMYDGSHVLKFSPPISDHSEIAEDISEIRYPSEHSDDSSEDSSRFEVKDAFNYDSSYDDIKSDKNVSDVADDGIASTESSEANIISWKLDLGNSTEIVDADSITTDSSEERIVNLNGLTTDTEDSIAAGYTERNSVIENDADNADDAADHDSIETSTSPILPDTAQHESCESSELLRLKVASGRDAEGKRFYVAKVGELQLPAESDAIAAAASAAIAAATAPVLELQETVLANNVNSDNADVGEIDTAATGTDESRAVTLFGSLARFEQVAGVGKFDSETNYIRMFSQSGPPKEHRRAIANEEKLRNNNNFIELFSLKSRLTTVADKTVRAGSEDFDKNVYTINDHGKLRDAESDVGGASDTNANKVDASDSTDASLRYIEVAVERTCDENGNHRIAARVLPFSTAESKEKTNAPGLDACPEEWRDVNWRDDNDNSALHLAAKGNIFECVDALVSAGTDLNAQNKAAETALFLASVYGSTESARRLIEAGADQEASIYGSWRPMHTAARHGHDAVVRLLLASGAEVDPRSHDKSTPLWLAAYYDHEVAAKLLLEAGADPEAANWHGITVRQIARRQGSAKVRNLLNDDSGESLFPWERSARRNDDSIDEDEKISL